MTATDLPALDAGLADAIWWFKGFAAALPPQDGWRPQAADDTAWMAGRLLETRQALTRLVDGLAVAVVAKPDVAGDARMVISMAQLEAIAVGLGQRPNADEIVAAKRTIDELLRSFWTERDAINNPTPAF